MFKGEKIMDRKIPKIIHYCWFGGNEKPDSVIKYMESWKKYSPDYEIIEWNEETFDIDSYDFARQAYNAGKFAFVTDIVRLYAIYNYGGIYMDTDVEVLKPLDSLLRYEGFSGFEDDTHIPTGIMAGEKGNRWFLEQLDYYTNRQFKMENGELDLTTNVEIITNKSKKDHGFIANGKFQILKYGFVIFPKDYFCPKSPATGIIELTENSYTIHHFSGTWVSTKEKQHSDQFNKIVQIFGIRIANMLLNLYRKIKPKF